MPHQSPTLTYHFQPIVDLMTGELSHHEALLRLLPLNDLPARFLEGLEGGWLAGLDLYAPHWAVDWLARTPDLALSVNLSPTSLGHPGFCTEALRVIATTPRPSRLHIELVESQPMDCRKAMRDFLHALRELGCPVALDDVGAGHHLDLSLLDLPISGIKIDGSHVQRMASGDRESREFVATCVAMARDRGMTVTGEFIETTSQRDVALDMGIQYGQGHLFGRPSQQPVSGQPLAAPAPVLPPAVRPTHPAVLHYRHA